MYSPYSKDKFTAKDYLKAVALGIIVTIICYFLQKLMEGEVQRPIYSTLSNAFLGGGGLLLAGGILSWVKNEGMFDVFTLGFRNMFNSFAIGMTKDYKYNKSQNLYEYREEKNQTRRVNIPWILVGIGFLAISVLFTVLFFKS